MISRIFGEFNATGPESGMKLEELSAQITDALAQLPDEQREVVVLKVNGGLKFRQVAAFQEITLSAAQARYGYGIDKLRSILNSEMEK